MESRRNKPNSAVAVTADAVGGSHPATAQKKRKGGAAASKLVTPNRDDDDNNKNNDENKRKTSGLDVAQDTQQDDPESSAPAAGVDEPGLAEKPPAREGDPNKVPSVEEADEKKVEEFRVPEVRGSSWTAAAAMIPDGAGGFEPGAAVLPQQSRQQTAAAVDPTAKEQELGRPLKRRKVMLCAGAAVVAVASLFAHGANHGALDTCCDHGPHHSTVSNPRILFIRKPGAPSTGGKVIVPSPLKKADPLSPSRTPARSLRGDSKKPASGRGQSTWNVSFLSGFLASPRAALKDKPDGKRDAKVRRPLSSFTPFAAQRDVLGSAANGEAKAVAVVPKSKTAADPGTAAGRGPWKRFANKLREAAVHVSSAAADALAGASPMNNLQG